MVSGTQDNPFLRVTLDFSLKSLKDSTNRLYDPARAVSGGETTRVGELSRLGR